jgi:hypothetical protein
MTKPILPLPPHPDRSPGRARIALPDVARTVLRKAQQQGFVSAREVRQELTRAGLAEGLWKDALHAAGASLCCRQGRYYYVPAGKRRMRVRLRLNQRHQEQVHRSVRWVIRQQRKAEAVANERRTQKRVLFNRPIAVQTDDQRIFHVVTRDISLSGIRLVADRCLQGQKLRVWITFPEAGGQTVGLRVAILWSARVGDQLFENGGLILDKIDETPPSE